MSSKAEAGQCSSFGALPGEYKDTARSMRDPGYGLAMSGGKFDIYYDIVNTAVGELLVASTDVGLITVAFACQDHGWVIDRLAGFTHAGVVHSTEHLASSLRQLEEYFAMRRVVFDLPLDLRLSGGFRRRVLEYLPGISYGTTASYASIGRALGSPGASRAVGTACARNPLPIVLPCHRVIRSDGSVGQFAGGVEVKEYLLAMESTGSLPVRA
ncbi:MAG: methylated-DNA--[protein]-cysteine S-methyltransferase [Ferrimicrobium sp.]